MSKSSTTISRREMRMPSTKRKVQKTMPRVHPGEVLREDFLSPLGLSVNRMSMDLHVPVTRMNDIARGRRSITADTALRLGRYFSTGAQFWLNLQTHYDLELATDRLADVIESQVKPLQAA